MQKLSDAALMVMGGTFGFNSVLTYGMVESEPSPEMKNALNELVEAGLLGLEIGHDDMSRDAIRYRSLVPFDEMTTYRKKATVIMNRSNPPKIRMAVKRQRSDAA